MKHPSILQPPMIEAAIHLGQNLISSGPYVRFQKAEQALNGNAEAHSLLVNLAEAQARVRKAQNHGTITPEDLQTLGDLQSRAQGDPIVSEYTTSQQGMTGFIQEINTEVSQLLGINFALVARQSGCC